MSASGFVVDREKLFEHEIPTHMHDSIVRFFEDGIRPGGFLHAVIDNDLREAAVRADDRNKYRLFEYVNWLWNCAPAGHWGYAGAVDDWLARVKKLREEAKG